MSASDNNASGTRKASPARPGSLARRDRLDATDGRSFRAASPRRDIHRPLLALVVAVTGLAALVLVWALARPGTPGASRPRPSAEIVSPAPAPAPPTHVSASEVGARESSPSNAPPPFDEIRSSLVILESPEGRASGFVALADGARYIYTAAHCVASETNLVFRTTDGDELKYESIEFADTRDIARLRLRPAPAQRSGLKITGRKATLNESLVIYGNRYGAGTLKELAGKVVGLGPELVEFDVSVVFGNSGGPVINSEGEVIGVVTSYLEEPQEDPRLARAGKAAGQRNFAARLDTPVKWTRVEPSALKAQREMLQDIRAALMEAFRTLEVIRNALGDSNGEGLQPELPPLHPSWAGFDEAHHRRSFRDPEWARLFPEFLAAHKQCRELEVWYLKTQRVRPLLKQHQDEYRARYGRALTIEGLEADRVRLQEERDARLKATIEKPAKVLKETAWLPTPVIRQKVQYFTGLVDVARMEIELRTRTVRYRNSQF